MNIAAFILLLILSVAGLFIKVSSDPDDPFDLTPKVASQVDMVLKFFFVTCIVISVSCLIKELT